MPDHLISITIDDGNFELDEDFVIVDQVDSQELLNIIMTRLSTIPGFIAPMS